MVFVGLDELPPKVGALGCPRNARVQKDERFYALDVYNGTKYRGHF